ncbi:MAG TPA: SulP family inorganic anion transporter [Candidatus Limnocylindrales bacterium]|nr:SulP family inorganic anion transporter [Candidatus Limnocylindrales bacterium]
MSAADGEQERSAGSGERSDADPELPFVDQPGLRRLREAVANVTDHLPGRRTLLQDAVAGLTVTVSTVPDGMANGLLAGVNPIYGLYANMVGPVVGGAIASTRRMVINNTSAVSLVAGQALVDLGGGGDERLFTMVMLAGLIALGLGILGLGRLTRFVSFSVMTGFIAGISVVLVLSQLPTITGIGVADGNSVTETFRLVATLGNLHLATLAFALSTIVLAVGLPRIGLERGASLIAIVVPTVVVALGGFDDVALVSDVSEIPRGIPAPVLPSLSHLSPELITGAIAVAAISLVQGSGVAQSVPNADGDPSDPSRDFVAQGAANLAAGLVRGLPVGGSLSGTAVNVTSGGAGRWAAISSGIWMAAIVLGAPALIARVVMPGLGALLILAGIRSIHPSEVRSVWRAGWPSVVAATTTFVSTLVLPIQVAVGFGVALSTVLYLSESSNDVSVVQLVRRSDGHIEEREAPRRLEDRSVTVLDVYGQLYFAAARTFGRLLPEVRSADAPVVVIRLRGRTNLSATLVDVITRYADELKRAGGRLYLSGASRAALEHLERSGFRRSEHVRVYEATSILGESTSEAEAHGGAWLVDKGDREPEAADDA